MTSPKAISMRINPVNLANILIYIMKSSGGRMVDF
jgi:hypothetical protein